MIYLICLIPTKPKCQNDRLCFSRRLCAGLLPGWTTRGDSRSYCSWLGNSSTHTFAKKYNFYFCCIFTLCFLHVLNKQDLMSYKVRFSWAGRQKWLPLYKARHIVSSGHWLSNSSWTHHELCFSFHLSLEKKANKGILKNPVVEWKYIYIFYSITFI